MLLLVCRIDCFSEMASSAFGEKMKEQVEERLRFYDEGVAPMKNITAMQVRHNLAELQHTCRPTTIAAVLLESSVAVVIQALCSSCRCLLCMPLSELCFDYFCHHLISRQLHLSVT